MQSQAGNGYALKVLEETDCYTTQFIAYILVNRGRWMIEGMDFRPGQAAMVGPGVFIYCVESEVHEYDEDIAPSMAVLECLRDITRVPVKFVDKPWGAEVIVDPSPFGLLKLIDVEDGERTSLQSHNAKDEVIIPVEGEGGVMVNGTKSIYSVGNEVHIRPDMIHRTKGPTLFFEGSTYHPNDVIRHEDDYAR